MNSTHETSTPVSLALVRIDGGTQQRARLDAATVEDYAEAMQAGAIFPPLTLFYDGADHWLADGFHRVAAAQCIGLLELLADVRQGTRRDALLFAAGANTTHGLRRSNADKRRAVATLLGDAEWSAWSDREIARRCAVTHPLVSKVRSELTGNSYQSLLRTGADGRTINTANIGRAAAGQGIRVQMLSAVQDAIATGRRLIEIRASLTSQQWRLWQETEFTDIVTPADNYVALAGRFGDVPAEQLQRVAPLALSMLTELPNLAIDAEFASLMPPLSRTERAYLTASLIEFGCIYWITTWRGLIVDGHQRYAICHQHGIAFRINEWQFDSREAVKEWIVNLHTMRRNLSAEQMGAIAAEMATYPALWPQVRPGREVTA